MVLYALFVTGWRYFYVAREPSRWKLTVEILEAWPGSRYDDLCISGLQVELVDPEDG